jgi:anaerobic selenocysteine-containing dehydrogenase
VAIVCGLAARLFGSASPVPWAGLAADYDQIRDLVGDVVPGFDDYNRKVRQRGGFELPHAPRDHRRFPTPSGRANFTVNQLDVLTVPPGRLLLTTIRSHDQFNTTVYGLDDRYRGVRGSRQVVFVGQADLDERGLVGGDVVDIVSEDAGGVERRALRFRVVAYPIARGVCAAYFPEANVLVPLDSTAVGSQTPTSKSIVVRLEKA